eukprot:2082210-Rhodomonas_salina.2
MAALSATGRIGQLGCRNSVEVPVQDHGMPGLFALAERLFCQRWPRLVRAGRGHRRLASQPRHAFRPLTGRSCRLWLRCVKAHDRLTQLNGGRTGSRQPSVLAVTALMDKFGHSYLCRYHGLVV